MMPAPNKKLSPETMSIRYISPYKANSFLLKKFAHIAKFGNMKTFRDFLASPKYAENYAALSPLHRVAVAKAMARAFEATDQKAPLPRFSKRGWRTWDAERIAKLKAADAKHGNDEGIAREMGISLKAAKAARWRHIGRRQRPSVGPATDLVEQAA